MFSIYFRSIQKDRDTFSVSQFVIIHHIQFCSIILRDVDVTVTPHVAPIAASVRSATDHFRRDVLPIVGPADPCERVDKTGSEIEWIFAQFASLIIPWKYMVIIVISFAERCNRYREVFDWRNVPTNESSSNYLSFGICIARE